MDNKKEKDKKAAEASVEVVTGTLNNNEAS